jgi:hypothetical protein
MLHRGVEVLRVVRKGRCPCRSCLRWCRFATVRSRNGGRLFGKEWEQHWEREWDPKSASPGAGVEQSFPR